MTVLEQNVCNAIISMAKKDEPDYWTRLEHQYAGMAMQGMLSSGKLNIIMDNSDVLPEGIAIISREFAHALVKKLKEKEKEERK